VQKHVKAMTERFNELSVIGAPMEEEDKVVTLLASLPDSFNMLVTAFGSKCTSAKYGGCNQTIED